MGATNEIKGTNISLQLAGKECSHCDQKFTEQEIEDRNFDIWFDTTNDVKLTPMNQVKNDSYYFPTGRKGYELTIWIRSIEHEDCPNSDICDDCEETFLEKEMEQYNGEYYCLSCYQLLEKDHE